MVDLRLWRDREDRAAAVAYNFGATSTDALDPVFASLMQHTNGNIWRTTPEGGKYNGALCLKYNYDNYYPSCGTVFEITP